jgi:nucleotide-binding universal stress UspA family protein
VPAEYHVSAAGVGAALAVLGSVSAILWWMLHPSVRVRIAFAPPGEARNAILVPVTPGTPPELLRLAATLAAETNGEVILLYVVEVPYTLPLDARLPDRDREARRAFLREQRRQLEELGVTVETKIARSRRAGKAIVDWARAINPQVVLLGTGPRFRGNLGSTASSGLENAGPLRVILYKSA